MCYQPLVYNKNIVHLPFSSLESVQQPLVINQPHCLKNIFGVFFPANYGDNLIIAAYSWSPLSDSKTVLLTQILSVWLITAV